MVVRSMLDPAMKAFLGLGLLVAALVGYSRAEVTKDPFDAMVADRPRERVPVPDLAFPTLEGREVRPPDLRGRVVLLGFFATA